jgi:PAS domain S-box-containing protein
MNPAALRNIPIRKKLYVVVMVTVGAALLLTSVALFLYELGMFRRSLERDLGTLAQVIGQNTTTPLLFDDDLTARETLSALQAEPRVLAAAVYDVRGALFASYERDPFPFPTEAPPHGSVRHLEAFLFSAPILELRGTNPAGTILLVADYGGMRDRLVSYVGIMLFVLAGSFVGSLLLSAQLQRLVSDPILDLARTARAISENQDYSVRVPKVTDDELGTFVDSFNLMLTRIQSQNLALREARDELEHRVEERTRELEHLQRQNELILNSAGEGIYGIDLEGRATFVNPAAASMTASTIGDMLGKTEHDLLGHPFSPAGCPLCQPVTDEALRLEELKVIRRDRSHFISDYLRTPIHEGSRLIGAVVVLKDITGQKQAQESLARQARELARSNEDLEQFAYVASHDLQEPLRMVANYTQLLARRYKDKLDQDAHDFIDYAVDGAVRMQGLINDLLQYSRVGTRGKEFSRINLADLLKVALSNLQRSIEENRATVTFDSLPSLTGDSTQIIQLFQNLIGNALKFHGEEPPRIHVGCTRGEDAWEFSVSDNGIGIDQQYQERIFVIFQRLHGLSDYAGTGIGLAICKKIVERHGGHIWVESSPGQGSRFSFTIPFDRGDVEEHVNDRPIH